MALVVAVLLLFFAYAVRSLCKAQILAPKEGVLPVYRSAVPARRGGIYDRNGYSHPYAESTDSWKIHIDPVGFKNSEQRATLYCMMLPYIDKFRPHCTKEKLFKAISASTGHYHPLGAIDDKSIIDLLRTNSLARAHIGAQYRTRREYPQNKGLCHVIGAVNSNEEPLMGLEKSLDQYLKGVPGLIEGKADATRREIRGERSFRREPINGMDVILTIDQQIQFITDEALDELMSLEYHPVAAWAVVQDTNTGEILALSSRPDFAPTNFGSATFEQQRNCAVINQYEPGSVMKSFVAAAAMNEGLVNTNSLIDSRAGLYCGRPLSDHVNGIVPLWTVLQKSSNRGASRLGMMLGKETQRRYLKAFGFGSQALRPHAFGTNDVLTLPIPGESTAFMGLRDRDRWSDLQNIRVSIGQGVCVNALQLAAAYSALANGGILYEPQIIRQIRRTRGPFGEDGEVVYEAQPRIVGRPITESVSKGMISMLRTVVAPGGTARKAEVPGYSAAGKTGTAQIAQRGGYSQTRYHGTFAGFVPTQNPRITIVVTAKEPPLGHHHGGAIAAPVFSRIASSVCQYLQIPTEPGFEEPQSLALPSVLDGVDYFEPLEDDEPSYYEVE